MTVLRRGRSASVVAAALVVVGLVLAPAGAGPVDAAAAPFVTGTAAASAQVTRAKVFYAGYSLQVALGLSATTYENRQSRALGGAYDLSAATGLLSTKAPEQISPISVDSNAGDATRTADLGAGAVLGHIVLGARAVPSSQAEVHLADADLTGLIRVEGGHSRATTEVVGAKERRATASVTIGSLSLAGGAVVLDGLRWEATQRSGAATQADGTFSLGRLLVGGVPIATNLHDLDPVLDAVNAALAPVGLVLAAPAVVHHDNGTVDITPIRIGVINSPLGAQVLGPIVAAVRPLLLPAFDALTTASSSLGLAALVADLGLGVADGSGGIELSVGGATARTDDTVFADPLGGATPGTPTLSSGVIAPTPGLGALPAPVQDGATPGGLGGTALVPASAAGAARCVLAASPSRHGTCRGANLPGAVAVVAVVGAGLASYEALLRRRRALVPMPEGPR